MQDTEHDRGRPPAEAPDGRVLLKDAAAEAQVSYATAYRRVVTQGKIPHLRDASGVISISRADAGKITRRVPVAGARPAIAVRPSEKEASEFARAAGKVAVSRWLINLGNAEVARQKAERAKKRSNK